MIRPLYMSAPSRIGAQIDSAYDHGRRDFQTLTKRAENPYLRSSNSGSYHLTVVGWYKGWDAEHEKARKGIPK